MKVRFDKEIFAWISDDGRLIAPRLDEDGWDFFFVPSPSSKMAEARFCSGEGYWAFGGDIAMTKYRDLLEEVLKREKEEDKEAQDALNVLKRSFKRVRRCKK